MPICWGNNKSGQLDVVMHDVNDVESDALVDLSEDEDVHESEYEHEEYV